MEAFAKVLLKIATEDPEVLRNAPESTPISRPDEVLAAKSPVLKWTPTPTVQPEAKERQTVASGQVSFI